MRATANSGTGHRLVRHARWGNQTIDVYNVRDEGKPGWLRCTRDTPQGEQDIWIRRRNLLPRKGGGTGNGDRRPGRSHRQPGRSGRG
jgi:hypothetical protein